MIIGSIAATGSIIGVTLFGLSATAQTLKLGANQIQFAENTWARRNSQNDRYCGAIAIAALPRLVSYYKKTRVTQRRYL